MTFYSVLTIRPWKAFFSGMMTDVLNPKIIIFLTALLSQYITDVLSFNQQIYYGILLVSVQFIWFGTVAIVFSAERLRFALYRYAHWIERISGLFLIALSLRLALSSFA